MAFDPTWPPTGAELESEPFRNQFNGLNDKIEAIPPAIPGPQGPPGNDGAQGPQGMQGPPGDITFPVMNPVFFDAPVYHGTNEVKFDTLRDPGGMSENYAGISASDSGSGALLNIRCHQGGLDRSVVRLDLTGILDGAGNPTVQDGAIYRYDAMTQTIKPWNVTVQTLNYTDSNGNPITVQVLVPPP